VQLQQNRRANYGLLSNDRTLRDTLVAEMDTLKVSIFVRDWAGNKSRTVKLPLSFAPGRTPEKVPAQWQQAAKNQLGYINNSIMSIEDAEIQ
jgi:hypothetical protein